MPNSALVTDACVAALRAFYSAAQRGRYMAKVKTISAGFLAALFVSPVYGSGYDHCFKAGTGTTIEINNCLLSESEKLDKQLKHTYQKVLNHLEASAKGGSSSASDAKKTLTQAQELWAKFKDADCTAVYEAWQEGTIRNAKHLMCEIERTRQRIVELQQWLPK